MIDPLPVALLGVNPEDDIDPLELALLGLTPLEDDAATSAGGSQIPLSMLLTWLKPPRKISTARGAQRAATATPVLVVASTSPKTPAKPTPKKLSGIVARLHEIDAAFKPAAKETPGKVARAAAQDTVTADIDDAFKPKKN